MINFAIHCNNREQNHEGSRAGCVCGLCERVTKKVLLTGMANK